jgi:hypothetical protein
MTSPAPRVFQVYRAVSLVHVYLSWTKTDGYSFCINPKQGDETLKCKLPSHKPPVPYCFQHELRVFLKMVPSNLKKTIFGINKDSLKNVSTLLATASDSRQKSGGIVWAWVESYNNYYPLR